jgi:hypothetical protein
MEPRQLRNLLMERIEQNEDLDFWETPDPEYDPIETRLMLRDVEMTMLGYEPVFFRVQSLLEE